MNNAQMINSKPRSGNKFVGGCLIAVAIIVILLAGAGWWFVGRPISQVASSAQELARIGSMDVQLNNRSTFTPPANGELQPEQVERYLAVLETIRADLQNRFAALEQRYEQVGTERPSLMDIPRLAGAYADFIGLLGQARSAQIEALNANGFSESEYSWTRREVLRAAGLQGADYDIGNFLTALGGQDNVAQRQVAAEPVPEVNRELVRQVQPQLGELGVLAILGL